MANVTNNIGVPARRTRDGYTLRITGTNYRPQQDLRVTLLHKPRDLHVALYSASSGSSDGFFALALTPDRALTHPHVRIQGVTTYQVVPGLPSSVKAYQAVTLFGRYHGSGPATVTLSGRSSSGDWSLSRHVRFSAQQERNNPASKLWAARRIEQLSVGNGRRAEVMALSMRFGMPSKYTSWLAVPKEEMRRYNQEKVAGQIEVIARRLAVEISNHRGSGRTARRLRARLNRLCRQIGTNPKETLSEQFSQQISELADNLAARIGSGAGNTPTARRLRAQFDVLCRLSGMNAQPLLLQTLAHNVIAEEHTYQPNKARIAVMRRQLRRTARKSGENAEKYLADEETQLEQNELHARMGDPLLQIEAPADAQQVIALMPGGEIKRLAYDPASKRWEARFDIPTYAAEGAYVITVVIVLKDGSRKTLTVRYHVDVTPPTGTGKARIAADRPALRLEMEASEDTARVKALLPWGEEVALRRSGKPHGFFALVPLSPDRHSAASVVTYILTDRAHNRTAITVNMEAN